MNTTKLQQLCDLAAKRDDKRYGWIRQLLLLASGSLTALVAFRAGEQSQGLALLCLQIAWATLGSGILLGASALHGEVWKATELAAGFAAAVKAEYDRSGVPPSGIAATLPARYKRAEKGCYISLLVAVVALVAHAILR